MALTLLKDITPSVSFAMWHINEKLSELHQMYPFTESDRLIYEAHKLDGRKAEWLAARLALRALMKDRKLEGRAIFKDEFGKPHIEHDAAHISISHTQHWGAAALSTKGPVGIDIEFPRDQIQRIARKFLHTREAQWAQGNAVKLTQVWCAKEALYKLHGRTQLIFAEQLYVQRPEREFPTTGFIREDGAEAQYNLYYEKVNGLFLSLAH